MLTHRQVVSVQLGADCRVYRAFRTEGITVMANVEFAFAIQ